MEQIAQKKRVAVYCRVSADNEDPSASRETQKARYTQKISEKPDWEMVGFYADQDAGVAQKNWSEFSKMIAACKQGRIDIIMVKSVSRFAGNAEKCIETVRMLKSSGIGVIFELERIDTLAESADMQLTTYIEFARKECEAIARRPGHPMVFPCRYGCVHTIGRVW